MKHMSTRHVWSREREKELVRAECDRRKHERGEHVQEVLERHNEEYVDGTDITVTNDSLTLSQPRKASDTSVLFVPDLTSASELVETAMNLSHLSLQFVLIDSTDTGSGHDS